MLKPIGMAGVPHVRPAYVVHVRQRCPAKNQRRTTRTTLTRSISDHNEELPISNSSSSCGSSFQATATTTDWGTNILQQQLPPEHTLQQLLQPLIQPSSGSSSTVPGDDVGPIAADSMSLTVNVPPPSPVLTVPGPQQADSASTMVVLDHMLDADSREWGCRTVQMDATAMAAAMAAPAAAAAASAVLTATAQQAPDVDMEQLPATAATKEAGSSWIRVVGVCAFASFLCYLDRTNISTAIVPMAEQFGWSKQFCGSVLSAFFAGYGATQVLGGQLSDKYGGSAVLAAGLAVWSLATALTPAAASAGTLAVLAARFMLGVGQGVAFPAIHALLAKRVPGKARSGAIGIIMACAHCGTAMGFGASPGIITSVGWAWTFYVFGAAALLWMPLWLQLNQGLRESSKQALKVAAAVTTAAVMTSTGVQTARIGTTPAVAVPVAASAMGSSASPKGPSTPPVRSATEQQREAPADQQASSSSTCTNKAAEVSASSNPNVGFWPLMRRKEVWAISVAQYTSGWGYYGLLAWLPQFFMEHCGMQLSQLGSFTLLPYLLQGIVGASAGLLADNLITKRGWKVRNVRIVMQVRRRCGLQAVHDLGRHWKPVACAKFVSRHLQAGMPMFWLQLRMSSCSSAHFRPCCVFL
jgi:ACS family sodium-dependent inorganic phosphate cotransporter